MREEGTAAELRWPWARKINIILNFSITKSTDNFHGVNNAKANLCLTPAEQGRPLSSLIFFFSLSFFLAWVTFGREFSAVRSSRTCFTLCKAAFI